MSSNKNDDATKEFWSRSAISRHEMHSLATRVGMDKARKAGSTIGRPKITANDAELIKLRKSGMSWKSISETVNISAGTVRRRVANVRSVTSAPIKKAERRRLGLEKIRIRKEDGCPTAHHPKEKRRQIDRILGPVQNEDEKRKIRTYEVFGGHHYCTRVYSKYGEVVSKTIDDGDALIVTAQQISGREKYDVVDSDDYGYVITFNLLRAGYLQDALLRKGGGYLFLTLGLYTAPMDENKREHFEIFTGSKSPGIKELDLAVSRESKMYRRQSVLMDCISFGGVYRMCFSISGKGRF